MCLENYMYALEFGHSYFDQYTLISCMCCRHKGQRDYKCGVCDFYGYTFTDIRKHIERKHSDSRHIYCSNCVSYFKSEAAFRVSENAQSCMAEMVLIPGPCLYSYSVLTYPS